MRITLFSSLNPTLTNTSTAILWSS